MQIAQAPELELSLMITRRVFTAALGVVPALCAQRVDVISHRGEHLSHPENTLPAIEAAIAIGCDWVEIDVRTTRDGGFVYGRTFSGNGFAGLLYGCNLSVYSSDGANWCTYGI